MTAGKRMAFEKAKKVDLKSKSDQFRRAAPYSQPGSDGSVTRSQSDTISSKLANRPDDFKTFAALTEAEKQFCIAYANTGSPTKAAISAGYKPHVGKLLMSRQTIKRGIARYLAESAQAIEITPDTITSELVNYALLPLDVMDISQRLSRGESVELSPIEQRLIKKIKLSPNQLGKTVEIELVDRQKAIETLGKILNLFSADNKNRGVSVQFNMLIDSIKQVTGQHNIGDKSYSQQQQSSSSDKHSDAIDADLVPVDTGNNEKDINKNVSIRVPDLGLGNA